MRIRDVRVADVIAGRNRRLKDDTASDMVDWEIEACSDLDVSETVVYSALTVFETGEVRPILLVREVGTYDWWGDTCEYVEAAWRALPHTGGFRHSEEYVAAPLENDPSFMGEYSHEKQRDGFARWRDRLRTSTGARR
jgi:hypothetical protein